MTLSGLTMTLSANYDTFGFLTMTLSALNMTPSVFFVFILFSKHIRTLTSATKACNVLSWNNCGLTMTNSC